MSLPPSCSLRGVSTPGGTSCQREDRGPQYVPFLGIVIDSVAQELRLPAGKLLRLLAGQLQHAASIVHPGRSFIRRRFDLLSTISKQHHHIRLSQGVRSDLAWWSTFTEQWNGVSFMSLFSPSPPTIIIETDAAGSWGAGAVWDRKWFQVACINY